jgi:hypothetical protein
VSILAAADDDEYIKPKTATVVLVSNLPVVTAQNVIGLL